MPATETLIVKHVPDSDPPSFLLMRPGDGRATLPVSVPDPTAMVVSPGGSDLTHELHWYLERFLDHPLPPDTMRAEGVRQALGQWGEAAFDALFGNRVGGQYFDAATRTAYARLRLAISSDDAAILSWPWEALRDPQAGFLAHVCQLERRLNQIRDPAPLSDTLPRDRIRILLVTARPYERDVAYRSISRRVLDIIARHALAAEITVLRPPTFESLQNHLAAHPHTYHVLHFDGHGAYMDVGGAAGAQGCLVFEDEHGGADPKTAAQLGVLLRDYQIPATVLNACQSATLSSAAGDAFASVATALLRAGVRGVVAMRYSLYVSAAQEFLPAFYRTMFESGSLGEATRAGRRQMLAQPRRLCLIGHQELDDWLVPVFYEQAPLLLAFDRPSETRAPIAAGGLLPLPASVMTPAAATEKSGAAPVLPAAIVDQAPCGFAGRDGAILALERALHRPPAGLLVHGLAGVGKSALARAFARWLATTDGVSPERILWLGIGDLTGAGELLDVVGQVLFGAAFAGAADRYQAVVQTLRVHRCLLVWDGFERVSGVAGTDTPQWSEADRQVLARLLYDLRGGKSKVLMTSHSPEPWLGPQQRFRFGMLGLEGEERWELVAELLRDLGRRVDRRDGHLSRLVASLNGHPHALCVVLPALERYQAAELHEMLVAGPEALARIEGASALLAPVLAAIDLVPTRLRGLLAGLALHEHDVRAAPYAAMAARVDSSWTRAHVDELTRIIEGAGVLHERKAHHFVQHPFLASCLRARGALADPALAEAWTRVFASVVTGAASGDGAAPA